ncbi:uncharacterized protein LOC106176427 [Lingula anatina]|uniref:Uncharacterized protein LOC106176427 n=1 Tax=Lingula anatina TaxID=7574 RepID=A0A1S3JV89_LINAN|nr:uncharacterized protein LOC106176427 [Lingula anatina]XP_013414259.1 uncharacterized protein LOC106176427 [Lingula anatina]|eukprot:XP_013414258.1 uncharacterized protein LOC106176427 [Lingula anatina]
MASRDRTSLRTIPELSTTPDETEQANLLRFLGFPMDEVAGDSADLSERAHNLQLTCEREFGGDFAAVVKKKPANVNFVLEHQKGWYREEWFGDYQYIIWKQSEGQKPKANIKPDLFIALVNSFANLCGEEAEGEYSDCLQRASYIKKKLQDATGTSTMCVYCMHEKHGGVGWSYDHMLGYKYITEYLDDYKYGAWIYREPPK